MTSHSDIPAFPLHNHGVQTLGMHLSGMTLRDYFAAKALQGLLATDLNCAPEYVQAIADSAYVLADAMLKARDGTQ